jgi:peptidyl-prolyl cis-trans isomerase A (cyclophilin A)/peptidyl-prolyl cis-trans isomerase B (cyclophilin B)
MRFSKFIFVFTFLTFFTQANAATVVEFETSAGNFAVELYPEKAPKTVENFLQYVKDGFYTNTIFHRVISRFMIQGGGFERDLTEKPTRAPIVNESDNGLLNQEGTIAMARTPDPNSATAQFFINLADNQFLNYASPEPERVGYCVFGKVVKGMEVVRKIGLVPTGNLRGFSDVPIKPIVIKQASIKTTEASK